MESGIVYDIKEFAVHDGPGIRTTVFLKGCPLRCSWCHNPEGLSPEPQIMQHPTGDRLVGKRYTSSELAQLLNQQSGLLSENEGGVTFSGGEPLFQPDFLVETITQLDHLHILLDTSGYASESNFRRVASLVDMLYFDLKSLHPDTFRKYCGGEAEIILKNLRQLHALDIEVVIRVPLIPGVTDGFDNMTEIAKTIREIPGLIRVDLLPYHHLAGAKYPSVGLRYNPGFDEHQAPQVFSDVFDEMGIPWRLV